MVSVRGRVHAWYLFHNQRIDIGPSAFLPTRRQGSSSLYFSNYCAVGFQSIGSKSIMFTLPIANDKGMPGPW